MQTTIAQKTLCFSDLKRKYPVLLDNAFYSAGKGWLPVIDDLCRSIHEHCDKFNVTLPHIKGFVDNFGELRIIYDTTDSYIKSVMDAASIRARGLCEECGEDGKIHETYGRIVTVLCRKHESLLQELQFLYN